MSQKPWEPQKEVPLIITLTTIPNESPLLDAALKAQLTLIFAKMSHPVTIKAITDLARDKDMELAVFLNSVTALSSNLSLELYSPDEKDRVPDFDPAWLPVFGLYRDETFGRVSFHGIPGGKEINSFVLAIYNLVGPGQELDKKLKKKILELECQVNIKICVSLVCHHCPGVVAACQRIAILNPGIRAEMIDAALYEDLVQKYDIKRVPMMIFNDKDIYMGNKDLAEIVELLQKQSGGRGWNFWRKS